MMRRTVVLIVAAAMSIAACSGEQTLGDDETSAGTTDEQSPQECMDFHRYVTSGAITAAELVEKCGVTAVEAEAAVEGAVDAPPSTAPPSTATPPPAPAEGSYGSDPTLDRLQDLCAGGDTDACSDLYWDSPVGSEYESFGQERMDSTDSLDGETLEAIEAMAMQMTWDGMSLADQVTTCDGYIVFGADIAYGFFSADTTDPISFGSFERFFNEKC